MDNREENLGESQTGQQNLQPNLPVGGNQNERLVITSGKAVVVDQFLLTRYPNAVSVEIPLAAGDYGIFRDPFKKIMVIHPASTPFATEDIDQLLAETGEKLGELRVETRAIAFLDKENQQAASRYTELFNRGDHKGARDSLREQGGAVRYGFDRGSDLLEVLRVGSVILIKVC